MLSNLPILCILYTTRLPTINLIPMLHCSRYFYGYVSTCPGARMAIQCGSNKSPNTNVGLNKSIYSIFYTVVTSTYPDMVLPANRISFPYRCNIIGVGGNVIQSINIRYSVHYKVTHDYLNTNASLLTSTNTVLLWLCE
jgi:hypothetical protein